MKVLTILFASTLAMLPQSASSQAVELTQSQLRQLVVEQQVVSAEDVVTDVAQNFGGIVKDIRGFFLEGSMTYRLLLQRADGQVVEILVNGIDGERISHNTPMGQIVSAVARATNGSANASSNGNNGNGNGNGNNGNGNSGNNGNGNSGNNGNGNSGNNGNGKGRNN